MSDLIGRLVRAFEAPAAGSSDYDLNAGFVLPAGRVLRPAGVLVALFESVDGAQVILTKRASGLKHHPGQIAFPGGKVEPGDDGVVGAALREAQEEIGLDPGQVKVLATLPTHETVTGFDMTPVLARVTGRFDPVRDPSEVDEVFSVPLDFVTNAHNFRVERRLWRGQSRAYFTVPYGPYYIWGATARILRVMADRLA